MPLIQIIVVIVVVGVILWAINSMIPMQSNVKKILNVVVILVLSLWLIDLFFGPIFNHGSIRIGR